MQTRFNCGISQQVSDARFIFPCALFQENQVCRLRWLRRDERNVIRKARDLAVGGRRQKTKLKDLVMKDLNVDSSQLNKGVEDDDYFAIWRVSLKQVTNTGDNRLKTTH